MNMLDFSLAFTTTISTKLMGQRLHTPCLLDYHNLCSQCGQEHHQGKWPCGQIFYSCFEILYLGTMECILPGNTTKWCRNFSVRDHKTLQGLNHWINSTLFTLQDWYTRMYRASSPHHPSKGLFQLLPWCKHLYSHKSNTESFWKDSSFRSRSQLTVFGKYSVVINCSLHHNWLIGIVLQVMC